MLLFYWQMLLISHSLNCPLEKTISLSLPDMQWCLPPLTALHRPGKSCFPPSQSQQGTQYWPQVSQSSTTLLCSTKTPTWLHHSQCDTGQNKLTRIVLSLKHSSSTSCSVLPNTTPSACPPHWPLQCRVFFLGYFNMNTILCLVIQKRKDASVLFTLEKNVPIALNYPCHCLPSADHICASCTCDCKRHVTNKLLKKALKRFTEALLILKKKKSDEQDRNA